MLRSMYSAISGMQAFETKLDVIGNNIANVNTTGFKASRVDFSDMLSQTMAGASAPLAPNQTGPGGTNPEQVGLGVKIAAIPIQFTQGAPETTGNPLDMAINGAGLFVVTPDNGTTKLYTRAGDFTLDANGNLVLPNGEIAMGTDSKNPANPLTLKVVNILNFAKTNSLSIPASLTNSNDQIAYLSSTLQIGKDGSISVMDSTGQRQVIGYLALATFANPAGLEKVGDSLFQVSANSGSATYQTPGMNNAGTLMPGALEMSNVDLTREFTEMIVAQRGFDANSKIIGTDNAILNDIVNLKNS
ncbi:flagellar basal body protein [Alicyclobacillus cellulosilyticus]|uniref:Flagellar hook protein FlgE n=1 Tax=Alicyclobacillus cellulosilyticus TaxID=1003997 RepID=A0A917K261_9BACL|nr:flagellar hook-basal body complex protein [Alicyclobacillus cellulosilyticus]GGI94720.1 flagellar basal body protein [Alicyclobacillus cellulosilyticus]